MFYLSTHSTHFILRLYDVRHMVKDHSDSEKWNTLPPHRLLFPINHKGYFICTIPQHTTAFVTPVVEHWLEREIAQWVHPMKNRSDDPSQHERTLLLRRYISLPNKNEWKTNDESSRGDEIKYLLHYIFFSCKIYISFLSFTPTKKHAPLLFRIPTIKIPLFTER